MVAVRPNEHVHKPVQVIFCSSAGNEATASVSFPRLIVQIGDGASLRLKQSFINEPVTDPASYGALVNCNTQVSLGRGTTLEHTYLQELDGTEAGIILHLFILSPWLHYFLLIKLNNSANVLMMNSVAYRAIQTL